MMEGGLGGDKISYASKCHILSLFPGLINQHRSIWIWVSYIHIVAAGRFDLETTVVHFITSASLNKGFT